MLQLLTGKPIDCNNGVVTVQFDSNMNLIKID